MVRAVNLSGDYLACVTRVTIHCLLSHIHEKMISEKVEVSHPLKT